MRRGLAVLVGLASTALVFSALASGGCSAKNEAIVCSSDWSGAAGTSCFAKYNLCDGGVYDLKCEPKTADTVTCRCIENGVQAATFGSDDACKVTAALLKQRARDNCKWTLD
jgi:hypothetical protein